MVSITNIYIGKVRNSASLNNGTRIIHTTNRISAFDFIFPFLVEKKAEILQALSVWYFNKTKHIIENHFIGCLNNTHILVKEAKVFPIEIIVRAYLTGSLWRLYQEKGPKGVFDLYGVTLPAGMTQNEKFPTPILTPSTKASAAHDLPISAAKAGQIIGVEHWNFIEKKALELFAFGSSEAEKQGLVLVDTKYEMGLYENKIILVDEVHTPDSSRYWYKKDLSLKNPIQISKEFLREEIIALLGNPDKLTENPANHPIFNDERVTKNLAEKISDRYQEMFQAFIPKYNCSDICKPFLIEWPISETTFEQAELASQMPKRVLIVGNGGRDYSLYHEFTKLPEVNTVYCASGNRNWHCAKYKLCPTENVTEIANFAAQNNIGLVVAGPELPIAQGLAEACENNSIPVLAPSLKCAELEASKILCKQVIEAAGIKTARSEIVTWSELKNKLNSSLSLPCVVKYDGLAAGKGVFVLKNAEDIASTKSNIEQNLETWEKLSSQVKVQTYSKNIKEPCFLIEEMLDGEEISVIALCNNNNYRLLPIARDYKRRNNNQTGANTGGMGAVSPVPLAQNILDQINLNFTKILNELIKRNTPYYGFLFAGYMIDKNNTAWLLEFNCRLGDPETQVLLPGLGRDFYAELMQTAKRETFLYPEKSGTEFTHDGLKRIVVVGVSPEYPEHSAARRTVLYANKKNTNSLENEYCEFNPTAIESNNSTTAGRIFGILATANTFAEARSHAYSEINKITLSSAAASENNIVVKPHFRTDIGEGL